MSRYLNDLDPRLRPIAYEHLARCVESRIPVIIVDTLRTIEEQRANVDRGVSWTMDSLHLPQPPFGLALAYDICPYLIWDANGPDKLNWDPTHPHWQNIGAIGSSLGLKWGVVKNGKRIDLGHFEYVERA